MKKSLILLVFVLLPICALAQFVGVQGNMSSGQLVPAVVENRLAAKAEKEAVADLKAYAETTREQLSNHTLDLTAHGLGDIRAEVAGVTGAVAAVETALQAVQNSVDGHLSDKNNPHEITAGQIGAMTLDDMEPILIDFMRMSNRVDDVDDSISGHIHNFENPHAVTASQIGAATTEALASVAARASAATAMADDALSGLDSHTNDFDNPHQVTAFQIGAATSGDFEELEADIASLSNTTFVLNHTLEGVAGEVQALYVQLAPVGTSGLVYDGGWVVGYTGTATEVVIPYVHAGEMVKGLSLQAKGSFAQVESLTMYAPELEIARVAYATNNGTVSYRLESALMGASNLASLVLAETTKLGHLSPYDAGVPDYGGAAFDGCDSLAGFSAPKLKWVGPRALKGVTIMDDATIRSIEAVGYEGLAFAVIGAPGVSLISFDSLIYAGPGAMANVSFTFRAVGNVQGVLRFPMLQRIPARLLDAARTSVSSVAVVFSLARDMGGNVFALAQGVPDAQQLARKVVGFGAPELRYAAIGAFGKAAEYMLEVYLQKLEYMGRGNYFLSATNIYAPNCKTWEARVVPLGKGVSYEVTYTNTNNVVSTLQRYYPYTNSTLKSLTLGAAYLLPKAFANCVELEAAYLGNLIRGGDSTFAYCTNLAVFYAPEMIEGGYRQHYMNTRLGQGYFSSMEVVGDEMFRNATSFTRLSDWWPDGNRLGRPWEWYDHSLKPPERVVLVPQDDRDVWLAENPPSPKPEGGGHLNIRPQEKIIYGPKVRRVGRASFRGALGLEIVNLVEAEIIGPRAFFGAKNVKRFHAPRVRIIEDSALRFQFELPSNRLEYINIESVEWLKPRALAGLQVDMWKRYGTGHGSEGHDPYEVASKPWSFPMLRRVDAMAFSNVFDVAVLGLPATAYVATNAFGGVANIGEVRYVQPSGAVTLEAVAVSNLQAAITALQNPTP